MEEEGPGCEGGIVRGAKAPTEGCKMDAVEIVSINNGLADVGWESVRVWVVLVKMMGGEGSVGMVKNDIT